jgi:hypothetical protein
MSYVYPQIHFVQESFSGQCEMTEHQRTEIILQFVKHKKLRKP